MHCSRSSAEESGQGGWIFWLCCRKGRKSVTIPGMERNETELVQASQAGDGRAFEELLSLYLRPVYTFVLSLTRDVSMAEDITQDACIKAWKHLGRFDTSKSFKTWLFTIAKNTAYDALKKKRAIPFSAFAGDEEEGETWSAQIADEAPLPDELLMQKDAAQVLQRHLEALSPGFQEILRLHYQEDFSLAEIAELLDQPYNTIKSRHGRALRQLKREFGVSESPPLASLGQDAS